MNAVLKMKELTVKTGVSREAIHFYLREGLLPQPLKPKPNVAHYTEEHVVRIKTIKRLQQSRSLSLASIKKTLEQFDFDALPASADLADFELAVQGQLDGDLPTRDQPVSVVAKSTGFSIDDLYQFDELGVISIKREPSGAALDFRDVGILLEWRRLLDQGFADRPGYDAHYLGRYVSAIKTFAGWEVEQFLDVFGGLPTAQAAALAAEGIGMTNDIIAKLRTKFLMRELHKFVGV
ncbi:MAG: MerR family transcriptional regulator [bacterium]